jgi:hypothetical protein
MCIREATKKAAVNMDIFGICSSGSSFLLLRQSVRASNIAVAAQPAAITVGESTPSVICTI